VTFGFSLYQTGNFLDCQRKRKIQFRTLMEAFSAEVAGFCIKNVFVSCGGCHLDFSLSIDMGDDRSILYDFFTICDMDSTIHRMMIFCKKGYSSCCFGTKRVIKFCV